MTFLLVQHPVSVRIISTLQILGLSVELFDMPEMTRPNYLSNWELQSRQKRKWKTLVIYASLELSNLHGIPPMSYPPPLKEGRRWHLIHRTFAKEKWKNTHTKHQQQHSHIPIGFWTYNLIYHPILVEGRSAIRPNSHWLRQGIYLQSLALFRQLSSVN